MNDERLSKHNFNNDFYDNFNDDSNGTKTKVI